MKPGTLDTGFLVQTLLTMWFLLDSSNFPSQLLRCKVGLLYTQLSPGAMLVSVSVLESPLCSQVAPKSPEGGLCTCSWLSLTYN
jgi:hypothetical protein